MTKNSSAEDHTIADRGCVQSEVRGQTGENKPEDTNIRLRNMRITLGITSVHAYSLVA